MSKLRRHKLLQHLKAPQKKTSAITEQSCKFYIISTTTAKCFAFLHKKPETTYAMMKQWCWLKHWQSIWTGTCSGAVISSAIIQDEKLKDSRLINALTVIMQMFTPRAEIEQAVERKFSPGCIQQLVDIQNTWIVKRNTLKIQNWRTNKLYLPPAGLNYISLYIWQLGNRWDRLWMSGGVC